MVAGLLRSAFLFSITMVLSVSAAWAARYLVIPKNQKTFSQIHSQWVLGTSQKAQGFLNASEVQVVESLEAVGAVIVDSSVDLEKLNKSAFADVIVEKEIFHKSPRPVEFTHHELTKPWGFSIASTPVDIFKKKKRKETKTEELAETESLNRPWGITAVKAEAAWVESNEGQGVRVLVLDTGIDRDHPALKANFELGKDFTGESHGDYEYADLDGHGTHVAGTIAAVELASGFVGVAPKARILAGKVCASNGCSNLAVVSGINWGIQQKVDVINMSLGGPIKTQAERLATERAEAAGVMIVAASGNDGVDSVSYPAAFDTVLAVGAIDINQQKADFSQWGPELDIVGPGVEVNSSVPVGTGRQATAVVTVDAHAAQVKNNVFMGSLDVQNGLLREVVFVGLGKADDFAGKDLTGKIALIQRGEITFAEKVDNAIASNAEGVVIFNNQPGLFNGSLSENGDPVSVPVIALEKSVGEQMVAGLEKGQLVTVNLVTKITDYSEFSGTSMASPHVAGVAVLVRATAKSLTPAEVRDVLKSTATELTGANNQNQLGAGLVDAEKAVTKAAFLR